jgi:replicative DNA helicase
VRKGHNPVGWDSNELLADAEKKLADIIDSRPKQSGFKHIDEVIKEAITRMELLAASKSNITGLSTGFLDLDRMTSGWQKSDLVIIAGRPSMGKTSFAMNMVENAILNQDKPVLVFSMEMPANQLMIRMMASIGKIDSHNMRSGKLDESEWSRLSKASNRLKNRPLYIDDTPGISPIELRNRVRQLAREHGDIGMIMVDYLQLMNGSVPAENRTNEITQISRELKAIAREFDCPVLALSQLSRKCEERTNKRPLNSDLRESGAIEQDADVVAFIYREEVYDKDNLEHKGVAEIIIGKQRNGPIGDCKLTFLDSYTRFENFAQDYFVD